jgi:hypothetical protein
MGLLGCSLICFWLQSVVRWTQITFCIVLYRAFMSLMRYHAIIDDGRRCRSCCNRCQLFGQIDILSGWIGECRECNIRWYRMQIRCACRGIFRDNFGQVGIRATALIYRYVGLDFKFQRRGVSLGRTLNMRKSLLTNTIMDSDDEFFDSAEAAVRLHPLTHLDDTQLRPSLETQFFTQGPSSQARSILDVVAMFLIKSPAVDDQCQNLAWLNSRDYTLETGWCKYEWQGREWLHNGETGEWFYIGTMQQSTAIYRWKCYWYGKHYWWLRGSRWFWEPRTLLQ